MHHSTSGVLNGAPHSQLFYEAQRCEAAALRRRRAPVIGAARGYSVEIAHGTGCVIMDVEASSESAANAMACRLYTQLSPAERDRRMLPAATLEVGTVKQRLIGTTERCASSAQIVPLDPGQRLELRDSASGTETRTVALTFSSEARVARPYGIEILSHARGAAKLDRLNDGAPLLFNHNMNDVIGVVENASIGNDRRGHATVRFARTPRGSEVLGMVQDRILRNVSIMYSIDDIDDSRPGEFLVTRWQPMELSIVTVPADSSVGVGRNLP